MLLAARVITYFSGLTRPEIGMLKDNKQKYRYNGKSIGLKELAKHIRFDGFRNIFGSVQVFTHYILLEWIRRQENDGRTLGELVYCVFDEVRDLEENCLWES